MSERSPSLANVFVDAFDARLARLHVSMPATVTRYDAARQCVNVQPILRDDYEKEDGSRGTKRIPVICDVPVSFPGTGPFTHVWAISPGDVVMLVFSERAIEKWLAYGNGDVDPEDDRRHHLTDAWCIPGVRPFSDPIPDAPTSGMVIGRTDGDGVRVVWNEDTVEVRSASGTAVALATKADVDELRTKLLSHGHATTCGSGAGTAAPTTTPVNAMAGTDVLKGE